MSINKLLAVLVSVVLATLTPVASADETDSHCVMEKEGSLFNRCEYAVDIGFCVENPHQTKNFFDSSEAFECPSGGLTTIGPGEKEGNILNGTVHWFACNIKHRGGGKWGYTKGSGYTGYCTEGSGVRKSAGLGGVSSANAEVWGEIFECNDWIPDQPEILRQIDNRAKKEMCKRARSPKALEISSREFHERKRNEAEAEQRKREDIARAEYNFQQKLLSQTPWQLAALADQLKASGDKSRERVVRSFLAERFPNNAKEQSAALQRSNSIPVQPVRESTPKTISADLSLASVKDCTVEQKKVLDLLIISDSIFPKVAAPRPPEELAREHAEDLSRKANELSRVEIERHMSRRSEYYSDTESRLAQARSGGNRGNIHRYEFESARMDLEFCFFRARLGMR